MVHANPPPRPAAANASSTAPAVPASVTVDRVSVVFGRHPQRALANMDAGLDRAAVKAASGHIFGVHDCSFTLATGEIVVLMGLSGSGKSTLLRTVNGLTPITRGALWVNDGQRMCNVAQSSGAELRHLRTTRIAMVFQQFALLPWRSVADNVGFGLELAGLSGDQRNQKIAKSLELVALQDWASCRIDELSGGMQQRVGLARALATEAPILLMDEPFSALDPLIRAGLQDELLQLRKKLRRTILFVSHDLQEAVKIGDRIIILQGGRIVQCADPRTIILQPATREVADFVAHINPLQVLCAHDVMRPTSGTAEDNPTIAAVTTPIRTLIDLRLESGNDITIVRDGQVVGRVGDAEILQAMTITQSRSDAERPTLGDHLARARSELAI